MPNEQTPISRAISDVLTGYYSRKRLTQEQVAARAEMSVVTLQKKLKAKAPITATDLVVLSAAIGVDPGKVLAEAMEEVRLSEAADTSGSNVVRGHFASTHTDTHGLDVAAHPIEPDSTHDEHFD